MNVNQLKIRLKYNKYLSKVYNFSKYVYFEVYNISMFFIGKILSMCFPIKNDKIVVVNYNGKGFGDNPKYIISKLLEDYNKSYDIVWLVNDVEKYKTEFPQQITLVKNESFKALKELSTAKIWIDNTRKRFYPPKRKQQIYIQTWHAGVGMKKTGKDTQNTDKASIKIAMKDTKMSDLMISNSKYRSDIYRNSFLYEGKILEKGIPRNDIIINHEKELEGKVKEKIKIKEDTKIVLYAPTFRKSNDMSIYSIDVDRLIKSLKQRFGEKWLLLVRLHPYLSDFKFDFLNSKKVIDVTKYNDLSELLTICDVVISDYSSLIFDFSITKKPVFLYAKDYNKYYEIEGLNFTKEELPFKMATSFDELLNNIQEFDENMYISNLFEFNKRVGLNETGESSKLIKEFIDSKIGE